MSASPTDIPTRPLAGTIPLPELVDWHTGRTGELPPALAKREPRQHGRHKWRPGDPVAWRPASLPALPAPTTWAGDE